MRLDTTNFTFLSKDDWRILSVIENESKNHEIVPLDFIVRSVKLDHVSVDQICALLTRYKLIRRESCSQTSHSNVKFSGSSTEFFQDGRDNLSHHKRRGHKGASLGTLGYILGFGGLDFLSLNYFQQRSSISKLSVARLGVGKEADVHVGEKILGDLSSQPIIVKFHRLGRTSFRTVRSKRDYHIGNNYKANSWIHLSMIAAAKEWAFLKALFEISFPVPTPIDHNRHAIVMEKIEGLPLNQISVLKDPLKLYHLLLELIVKLAKLGLVHGDFNEFNIMIRAKDESPVIIDFPQMVSVKHRNAEEFYERDIACVNKFFLKKFTSAFRNISLDENCAFSSSTAQGNILQCPENAISTNQTQYSTDVLDQIELSNSTSGTTKPDSKLFSLLSRLDSEFSSLASDSGSSSEPYPESIEAQLCSDSDSTYGSSSDSSSESEQSCASIDSGYDDYIIENRTFPPPFQHILNEYLKDSNSTLDLSLKASGYSHGIQDSLDKYWGYLTLN